MSYSEEPPIGSDGNAEEQFQTAIATEVTSILEGKKSDGSLVEYFIFQGFGLDLAIFLQWADGISTVRFLELKAFVGSRQGGVGFGNGKGEGAQVDLLLLAEGRLALADVFTRWLLVDCTRNRGTPRYVIFDNSQARSAAMGGVARSKQNNLRVNQLMQHAVTWETLSNEIHNFLTSTKYFAYGSNMDPQRMNERDVHFSQRRHAILKGYALKFNKVSSNNPREGYANIVQKKDEIVEGVLYEIPESDLSKLDRAEGYPTHYQKMSVLVKLDDDTEVWAVTYVAQPSKLREGLKPTREYLNHLLAAQDILSESYVEKLRSVETLN
jgi:cation transport regulator ChaC